MVERYRRKKGKRQLLGNHQKSWLWGRHTVNELLRVGKWPISELYLSDSLPEATLAELYGKAQQQEISVEQVSNERLTQLCHSGEHQGFLARMEQFPFDEANDLIQKQTQQSLFLILDRIQDPFNFGAIIRVADCLGVDGLFIPNKEQVGVTSQVARSSAGAVNHVPICRVDDLAVLAKQLQQAGSQVVAASEKAQSSLMEAPLAGSTTIVIGNEGEGINSELLDCCDQTVSIPQLGQIGSLNAAVATGIILYEVQRQRAAASL